MMKKWQIRLAQNMERRPPRERNWPVVRALCAVCLAMLAAHAVAEFGFGERALGNLYYVAALAIAALAILFHQNKRLYLDRPPA